MEQNKQRRARFFPMFVFALLAFAFASFAVQFLWNWIIAPTFSLVHLGYWQAMGLLVFCRLLFGHFSLGRHAPHRPYYKYPKNEQEQYRQKIMNMTEEERQQFKSEWKKRCEKRTEQQ